MKRIALEKSLSEKLRALKQVKTSTISEKVRRKALFIFHRDLRVIDNTALFKCSRTYDICPIFIFTPEQVADNPYKSSNSIQFMIESLTDLSFSIEKLGGKFYTFFGDNNEVVDQLIKENNIAAVYSNKDYTPYSIKRDEGIKQVAKSNKVDFVEMDDILLIDDIHAVKSNDDKYYYIFNHFNKKASQIKVRPIQDEEIKTWATLKQNKFSIPDFKEFCLSKGFYEINEQLAIRGGRKEGWKMLEGNTKNLKNYAELRNYPAHNKGTSHLSPHNKFGTISIRELYWYFTDTFGANCDLIRQLYWRDFFYYLCFHFPDLYKGSPIPSKVRYSNIKWESNDEQFARWTHGTTGFPFVDAGMREMNATGYMHNRARMITAMFLTKDMITDWRKGEKYFSNKLVDIDRAQNLGNWIWSAGTGPDGSPWLRIFNPWTQLKKFDPECLYVKKWIPELNAVPAKAIHEWNKHWTEYKDCGYPEPMLDHDVQKVLAIKNYGGGGEKSKDY